MRLNGTEYLNLDTNSNAWGHLTGPIWIHKYIWLQQLNTQIYLIRYILIKEYIWIRMHIHGNTQAYPRQNYQRFVKLHTLHKNWEFRIWNWKHLFFLCQFFLQRSSPHNPTPDSQNIWILVNFHIWIFCMYRFFVYLYIQNFYSSKSNHISYGIYCFWSLYL